MNDNINHSHWLETYKSLVTLSTEVFKFCALANGGAAVAILAYLGNLSKGGVGTPDMRCPMAAFLIGLSCCGVAMISAYWTQLSRLNKLSKGTDPSIDWRLWVAVLFAVLSLAAFVCGSWLAVSNFK